MTWGADGFCMKQFFATDAAFRAVLLLKTEPNELHIGEARSTGYIAPRDLTGSEKFLSWPSVHFQRLLWSVGPKPLQAGGSLQAPGQAATNERGMHFACMRTAASVESRKGAVPSSRTGGRPVSLPRSSNRTCPFRASGFPTDFTNGSRTTP